MKKLPALLILVAAIPLTLIACEANTSADGKEKNKNNDTETDEELTVSEVFGEALRFMDDAESFSLDLNLKQQIDSDEGHINTNSTQVMDMDLDTSEMKIEGTDEYKSKDLGLDESDDLEIYVKPDDLYYTDSELGSWLRFKDNDSEKVADVLVNDSDPLEMLGLLAEYKDDFDMEHTKDSHILKLDVSGDKYSDIHNDFIQRAIDMDDTGLDEDELEKTEIETFTIELDIDQETSEITRTNVDMVLNMDIYGEKATIDQQMKRTFHNYNNVDDIEVPEDAVEQAEDADDALVNQIVQ